MLTTAYISAGDVRISAGNVSIFSVTYYPVASWPPFYQQCWRQHRFVTTAISWRHIRWRNIDEVTNDRHFISSFMVSYQNSFVTAAILFGVDTKDQISTPCS